MKRYKGLSDYQLGWKNGMIGKEDYLHSGSSFFGYLYKRHEAFAALDGLVIASLDG